MAPIAQRTRALGFGPRGWEFESLWGRQKFTMDTQQQQNQDDYSQLQQNVDQIDPKVLNTPAKEPKKMNDLLKDQRDDAFVQFNQPGNLQPKQDVVLDLGGKPTQLNTQSDTLGTSTNYLKKVFGEDINNGGGLNPNFIIIGILIFIGLFFFILFNIKKSDQISRLESELKKLQQQR